jgi:hypothetical protein
MTVKEGRMDRPLIAVLLAGTLRPAPLREAMGLPIISLPMGSEGTLLDAWLRVLRNVSGLSDIRVVLNSSVDVDVVRSASALMNDRAWMGQVNVTAVAEPAAWRGAGGIIHDVSRDAPEHSVVLAMEALTLPPPDLQPMIDGMTDGLSGLIGIVGEEEPSGVYAFSQAALAHVPAVGYCDMKEQLLPNLTSKGCRVRALPLSGRLIRIRDRRSYLSAVRRSLETSQAGCDVSASQSAAGAPRQWRHRVSKAASVSGTAILAGCCVIEAGAVVEDGAVVHDSVVLAGATIGGGAIVSRSIIGPLATVEPRNRLVREIVHDPAAVRRQQRLRAAQTRRAERMGELRT